MRKFSVCVGIIVSGTNGQFALVKEEGNSWVTFKGKNGCESHKLMGIRVLIPFIRMFSKRGIWETAGKAVLSPVCCIPKM